MRRMEGVLLGLLLIACCGLPVGFVAIRSLRRNAPEDPRHSVGLAREPDDETERRRS